jgi:hypothetical protein
MSLELEHVADGLDVLVVDGDVLVDFVSLDVCVGPALLAATPSAEFEVDALLT